MITIGIRAAPKAVTFAVYDSQAQAVVNVEEIIIPAAFEMPDRLKYVRSNLLDIIREYKVEQAGVRITEPTAEADRVRVQLEGVIQEAFASSELVRYYIGQISSISSKVGIERTEFKLLVEGKQEYPIESWSKMNTHAREALLCAVGAVNA